MNKLGIVSIVVIALAVLVFMKMSSRRAEENQKPSVTVTVPKLKSDAIDELELSSPDKPKVRLVKKDGAWRVAEPLDAKADQNAVTTALTKLSELEVSSVAATLKKNHEKLEVDEKSGTHVIAKGAGKTLLDGYIGAYRSGSSMLRLQGQEAVAAVRGSIRFAFSKDLREWRDRSITEIPTESVQSITFVNKNGKLAFKREGDAWKQVLAKGEKPIQPLDESKVKGIVGTSSSLSATDFADPTATPEAIGLGNDAATVLLDIKQESGESQLVYRIGAQKEQSYYLRKDGDDTIYLVSAWIGGRLLGSKDSFIKKAEAPSGSPENPIQVSPQMMRPGGPGGNPMMMMPPQGHP